MDKAVPVHVLVLNSIENHLLDRLEAHREKTGDGLNDQDYQRHVGRIAELKVTLSAVEKLRKQLRVDDDIEEGEVRVNRKKRRSG